MRHTFLVVTVKNG